MVIGAGSAMLSFELEIPSCGDAFFGPDEFEVTIDGNIIFQTDNTDASCGQVGYQTLTFDVSTYANGANHTLEFYGTVDDLGAVTNFMVDDVQLIACP